MITIKKVTRLRVRFSKSRIKSIFMVFPSVPRQTHLFWKLFYFNVFHYNQWCHLNMFWELYDYYQKSNKTYSKNFQIYNKVNLYGFSLWSETNTPFLEVILFQRWSLQPMVSTQYVLRVISVSYTHLTLPTILLL